MAAPGSGDANKILIGASLGGTGGHIYDNQSSGGDLRVAEPSRLRGEFQGPVTTHKKQEEIGKALYPGQPEISGPTATDSLRKEDERLRSERPIETVLTGTGSPGAVPRELANASSGFTTKSS